MVDLQSSDHALDAISLATPGPVPANFALRLDWGEMRERMSASCRLARMMRDW
jgi:hypothetical protein